MNCKVAPESSIAGKSAAIGPQEVKSPGTILREKVEFHRPGVASVKPESAADVQRSSNRRRVQAGAERHKQESCFTNPHRRRRFPHLPEPRYVYHSRAVWFLRRSSSVAVEVAAWEAAAVDAV